MFKLNLVSVEISNFKSFGAQDSQLVGPFLDWTGIVGPNGVGKSNVIDAIAFALNLNMPVSKIRHIRDLAHISQLINGGKVVQKSNNFYVKLNILKKTGDKFEKLSIQRGLKKMDDSEGYANQYIVNENYERPLIYDEYRQFLQQVYDMPKQQFFTVYQS